MTLHLNGGKKFSELHYDITFDGHSTGIKRRTQTSGSPKYLKIIDEFLYEDETFDILATKGVGMMEWIAARIHPNGSKGATP